MGSPRRAQPNLRPVFFDITPEFTGQYVWGLCALSCGTWQIVFRTALAGNRTYHEAIPINPRVKSRRQSTHQAKIQGVLNRECLKLRHYENPRDKLSIPQRILDSLDTVRAGREVMEAEANAVFAAAQRLDQQFLRAVESILGHRGKVVVTAIGKSGRVAEKLVATLSSTGTPAVFLHPVEASHGDLGIYHRGDPTIFISKSGTTSELLRLIPLLRELESPLIGILGNLTSALAGCVDIVLDATIQAEADPHNLTPSSSTSVAAALGDALAIALMSARNFMPEDFARNHPGGQLGRNLRLNVQEVMKVGDQIAWAAVDDPLKQVIIAMTQRPMGAACVISEDGTLLGVITEGDLRRALQIHDEIRGLRAGDVMTRRPVAIQPDATLHHALQLMENRPRQISVLPVIDAATRRCLGLLRLHDIYQAGIIP